MWLLAYSLLLVGCFVAFQYHREKEFKQTELNARLQGVNAEIMAEMRRGDSIPAIIAGYPDLRISIISPEGTVVYDNSIDPVLAGNHLYRHEIAAAMRDGEGYTVRRHSESTGDSYFYSATRGKDGYIVRCAMPYSVSLSELLRADMGFLWMMGGVAMVMCIFGYIATRRVGQNIMRLKVFAEKAERGERIYDMAPFPRDELGAISSHIVKLYADLQRAVTERDREHRAALREQEEKERIKKQLTNNINHELKTPVASIQVCLEMLMSHKNLSEEKKQEFLGRCMENTGRLKQLLADVAVITRMDEAPDSIAKSRVDLAEIIAEVVEECDHIAAKKDMVIEDNVRGQLMMMGNRALLESVFRNLVDNAIAYSGGTVVRIGVDSVSAEKITLSVADNGCGVPPEHLPRIFERFYRIDKGRSRSAGGTGLGLSIVKNAVAMHGGSISVENASAGGLRFAITLSRGLA